MSKKSVSVHGYGTLSFLLLPVYKYVHLTS